MIAETLETAFRAMGELVIREERLADFWDDALPLLRAHWQEIAAYQDIPLKIDRAAYAAAEDAGRLCIMAARVGSRLVGYAVFFVVAHPHYAGSLQAQEDVIYLAPSLRLQGFGTQLLETSEHLLRAKGVQVVHHHVKLAHPALGLLLERHGYVPVETLYSKRLDRKDAE